MTPCAVRHMVADLFGILTLEARQRPITLERLAHQLEDAI
ncbi:hypothetical protein X742_24885 [Mesorhizobium sp. LNHC232B00]|nr:hypothetical protein X742_24885 [Mesorhizobium sp. LNHC232B00]